MRIMAIDELDHDTIDVYDGEPADGTYVGNVRREYRGWVAWRHPWKGVTNGGHQRDAAGGLIHFGSAEDAATFLVPDPSPVVDASGPKGQEQPVKGNGAAAINRAYTFDRIDTQARRNAVRARAGDLYRAGTHTPVKAWDAAIREDWFAHLGPVPGEDSFGVCVPVMGGAGHTFTPDGDFPPVPTCRSMDRNSRGTAYRVVDHGVVTCDTCLTYRARRQERRDRIAKG